MTQATDAPKTAASEQALPLKLSRIFHARREVVWKAWFKAEHVKAWFCPEIYTVPDARVDMRVGGAFDVLMRAPTGEEHWTRGTFVEVTPHDRLVIDMGAMDAAGKRLFRAYTEVRFTDAAGGTLMEVVQTYTFDDPAMAALMVAGAPLGWSQSLDKLERVVAHMAAAPEIEAHTAAKARIPQTPTRSVVHASFHLERTYDAPVARVWTALTDVGAKSKWFGGLPGQFELLERTMEVREGGRERLKGRWEGGVTSTFDAIYHDVIVGERLVYSYVMHLDDTKISASLATLQLTVDGGRTVLSVTEQGAFLDDYDDADSREHGTGDLLDALGRSLAD